MGQPRWNVVYAVVSLTVGFTLNVLLVPRLGINGSAVATGITNVLAPLSFVYILRKALLVRVQFITLIKLFFISTLLDLLVLLGIQRGFHPCMLAPLALALYVSSLRLTGIAGRQDIVLIGRIFNLVQ
jgi:O-antigen/teichoic acid export membrane protein